MTELMGTGPPRKSPAKGLSGNKRPIHHCERSEAMQGLFNCGLVWVASLSLAMTGRSIPLFAGGH
jgi:hypothetical protein